MVNVLDTNLNDTLNASSSPTQRIDDINTAKQHVQWKKEPTTSSAVGDASTISSVSQTPIAAVVAPVATTTSFPTMPVLIGIGLGGAVGFWILPKIMGGEKNYYYTIGLAAIGGIAAYFYANSQSQTSSFSGSSSRTNPSRTNPSI